MPIPVAADTPKYPFLGKMTFSTLMQSSKSLSVLLIPLWKWTWNSWQIDKTNYLRKNPSILLAFDKNNNKYGSHSKTIILVNTETVVVLIKHISKRLHLLETNKAKRFAKQLLFDVINALVSVNCVYCCQNLTGWRRTTRGTTTMLFC